MDYGPSQAQTGIGALLAGFGQGYSAQRQAQNQAAYMQALYGQRGQTQQDLLNQRLAAQKSIDDANNARAVQVDDANNATKLQDGGAKPLSLDVGTQRRIIGSGNYQKVYNDYVDLYNKVNSTPDPAQHTLLAQQALAHGGFTAPINTWMADSPDLTPDQRAAGAAVSSLAQRAQQVGAGEQLRFMHAMETLNQQTGGMRPANVQQVQHVYETTPGLDAPNGQFAYMMQTQADSAVPWGGLATLQRTKGQDPSAINAQGQQYMKGFHQVGSVPYDQNNRPQTTDFGYGQPATNGVAPLGSGAAPAPTTTTSPAPSAPAGQTQPAASVPLGADGKPLW